MKRTDRLNAIWWTVNVALVFVSLAAIYIAFWVLESWGWRILVLLGTGTGVMFLFMASTFLLAGLANTADREERRAPPPPADG